MGCMDEKTIDITSIVMRCRGRLDIIIIICIFIRDFGKISWARRERIFSRDFSAFCMCLFFFLMGFVLFFFCFIFVLVVFGGTVRSLFEGDLSSNGTSGRVV